MVIAGAERQMTDETPWTGIGAEVRRREDQRLLSGQGRYSDDLSLPGQVYAIMLRSPHAHTAIERIDTAAACAAPGVLAVLTGQDLKADGLRPIPHAVWSGHPAEIAPPNTDGSVASGPAHDCMATDIARHAGISSLSPSPPALPWRETGRSSLRWTLLAAGQRVETAPRLVRPQRHGRPSRIGFSLGGTAQTLCLP
jgi:Aldehyde oxidase and xanthine dehydrogenase, a/b hammerhead domain